MHTLGGDTAHAHATEETVRELARRLSLEGRVFILADHEPYRHDLHGEGVAVLRHSRSEVVTAVEPLIRATSGTWIARGAGLADHLTVERNSGLDVPPFKPTYRLRRVWLTNEEVRRYRDGFANEGLWPLCHRAHVRPRFRTEDFDACVNVNRRFVECLLEENPSDSPTVLVQDYHLALVPLLLRQRLPRSTIVAFWHVPWPAWPLFEACPWKREIVTSLLHADIVGFQTPGDCENFLDTAARVVGANASPDGRRVTHEGRWSEVHAYPASLEWPSRWTTSMPPVEVCRRDVRDALDLRPDALVSLGVARLDYTKGIDESFRAIERLLQRHPEFLGRLTHVQLAEPSRAHLPAYRDVAERVGETAGRINRRFGQGSYRPLVLLREHQPPSDTYRFLRAADVCYLGSLHDGMNLVAKEFVAARDDGRGALVLSVFAGAAWQLPDAAIVNPYDFDEVADALARALVMSPDEQRETISRMRAVVAEANAHKWAMQILTDVGQVRRLRSEATPRPC
jgi:trehalose 6-phosphate synthase